MKFHIALVACTVLAGTLDSRALDIDFHPKLDLGFGTVGSLDHAKGTVRIPVAFAVLGSFLAGMLLGSRLNIVHNIVHNPDLPQNIAGWPDHHWNTADILGFHRGTLVDFPSLNEWTSTDAGTVVR